jgi:raffinose/stachyose/melibiose transport system substrate-binding protein
MGNGRHVTRKDDQTVARQWKRHAKSAALVVILALFAYILIPPAEEPPEGGSDKDTALDPDRKAAYTIKFSAGGRYQPGARPHGIGEPLQGLRHVIAAFEERFPDTRIEVVRTPRVREYLVTQLSSGSAPDILNVAVEDVWVDTQKDWYVPLDSFLEAPNPFVVEKGDPELPGATQWWDMFRYQAISRGKAAPDGKNYCLTLDMVETGIYYNKTIFNDLGLTPPEDWDAFMRICETIRMHDGFEHPTTPLLMDLGAFFDWGHDLIFDQLYYGILPGIDLKTDPTREAYLKGYLDPEELAYLNTKGFFTERDPRYREMWRLMKELKQYTNRDLSGVDFVREFVNQRGVMLWSASPLVYRFNLDKKLAFDWGVFYLPKFTRQTSKYASGVDMCVIGGSASKFEVTNSAVNDTPVTWPMEKRIQASERLKRVMAFLQFLCLPEQAQKVINEYPCLIPNIVGVEPLPELKDFVQILERRYTTTKWIFSFDLRFSDILERMLSLYLSEGGIELDEFMAWQIKNVEAGCVKAVARKGIDLSSFDQRWQELAPIRATYMDLPSEAP